MPKFMILVSYTAGGAQGVLKDGGSKRRAAAKALIESLGGKLESIYFAFGKYDAIVISELPDNAAAAAAALAVGASGMLNAMTTVLLTPEEVDQAVKKQGTYTPPG